jgi:hypothetical protein
MLIFTLGLLYLFFLLVVVARPPIAIEGVHGERMNPNLFTGLMGVMHLI